MALASLRKQRVAIYAYTQVTDQQTGITDSVYVRVKSADFDGLWWASVGTVFGKETGVAQKPQAEDTSFWSFANDAPVDPKSIIALGDVTRTTVDAVEYYDFIPTKYFRIQNVMPRDYFRASKQAFCTHVDDADLTFVSENNSVTL